MTTYLVYLANAHGKKLSAYDRIEASTFQQARAVFRAKMDAKGISREGTEILAAH